jgi:hypothetical protein
MIDHQPAAEVEALGHLDPEDLFAMADEPRVRFESSSRSGTSAVVARRAGISPAGDLPGRSRHRFRLTVWPVVPPRTTSRLGGHQPYYATWWRGGAGRQCTRTLSLSSSRGGRTFSTVADRMSC